MDRIDDSLLLEPRAIVRSGRRYSLAFAHSDAERREAQRLRWRVFVEEMGARLRSREPGVDEDLFDSHCRHLLVRDEESGEVIGTYRLLPPHAARRVGCYYSETEFDLTRLQLLRPRMVELGRSCVDPRHRAGTVIALLWSGVARYMLAHGFRYLAGCASISLRDGGRAAAAAFQRMRAMALAPIEYQVFPRAPLELDRCGAPDDIDLPPLIKGYLRCGAWVCGEPAWDPYFNSADFFMFLPLSRVTARYARHFLREAASRA
ncbi:MAG TPA: GNAT family N-acyltransferase [Burkholderiales bacterium]|nr:GNAT family N-acyltransferase [Burkholderiales bacterium]